VDTHKGAQGSQLEGSLSIQEAALFYGVAEKTIRRRIKTGALRAVQHPIAEGFEWRVYPEGTHSGNGTVDPPHEGPHTSPPAGTQVDPTIAKALELIERMHADQTEELERLRRENQQLAGQVGFVQAKLQDAEEQIRLLMAPKDEPTPATAPERRPWWKRLLG
jgi:hypothetical protein